MVIKFSDQKANVADTGFRDRVEAGCMSLALSIAAVAVTGTPITGSPTPHVLLADAIIEHSTFAVDQFCWAIIGKPQLTNIDDATDQQISNVVAQFWDPVASALTPARGP